MLLASDSEVKKGVHRAGSSGHPVRILGRLEGFEGRISGTAPELPINHVDAVAATIEGGTQ